VPTGGVTVENAAAFIAAGATAVGVGSAMVPRDAMTSGDYSRLTEYARRFTRAIRAVKERLG
jgi:2-dehydro-3-deoxyphosphogluconate aldolase/(4S)-4-hydroxy-2-oxoglutarate aldolase